ncbi:EmrB/QacA subfamily drug resistance transporter [Streptomyces griseochromogenes]|uniref:EmrB/QacA subfamily drug resistance transporter n=1 Tax=Streptomyces griseochromogenes TaxID=68214 RepID=A0A1B1AY46_9ACTN|nr:MFS transporter [Streptomyces griseochromogenes]ANP51442.1 MFS transporter [Streptomyces griseochromogenes]MBP2049803.1 EmrB/QacA subfamily drug resistance transporter [Streptomyces griseochromogenes]
MQSAESGAAAPHKGWTLALSSVGVFMAALDALVVTTALPVLRTSLNAGLGDLEWTVNAYVLTFACLLLPAAALADRFGRRRVFAVGLVVFAAASAMAALAPSVGVLIAARAGEGLGAAVIMPISLTLISDAFPVEKRGAAIGMWGAVSGVAVAIGPVVGGAVVSGLNWHWIFWFNVPIGVVAALLSLSRLTESYGPRQPLDLYGLALACAGFFLLAWGLVRVSSVGWGSAQVIFSLLAGAVVVAAFLVVEGRRSRPMVRLDLFRNRAFNAASWVTFFMYAALFGALFLMSQFLQTGLGDSPLKAGLHLLAWTGVSMFIAPAVGPLADKYGNRPFMALGMALQAIGFGWVAMVAKPGMGFGELIGGLLVAGAGIGIVFPTVANGVMTSVGPDETGIASGTSATLRELGGVFGVAFTASVFSHAGNYTSHQTFITNFSHALWLCAALSAVAIGVSLAYPRHRALTDAPAPAVQPVGAAVPMVND